MAVGPVEDEVREPNLQSRGCHGNTPILYLGICAEGLRRERLEQTVASCSTFISCTHGAWRRELVRGHPGAPLAAAVCASAVLAVAAQPLAVAAQQLSSGVRGQPLYHSG